MGVGNVSLSRFTRLCESPDPQHHGYKGTRYERKIVGDSPEMCRALDSHGFADLKSGLVTCASYTSLYPDDNPSRFHLDTHAVALCRTRNSVACVPVAEPKAVGNWLRKSAQASACFANVVHCASY